MMSEKVRTRVKEKTDQSLTTGLYGKTFFKWLIADQRPEHHSLINSA